MWGRPRWAQGLSPHTRGWWGGGSVPYLSRGWPSLALGAWGGAASSIRGQGEGAQPRVTV